MNQPSGKVILHAKSLSKTYQDGNIKVEVFKELDLKVKQGERIAIIGASGAGKSTLLHLLGGLDKPSSGEIIVEQTVLSQLSENQRSRLRNQKFGFIYQLHHLLPEFSVLENVCMPLLIGDLPLQQIQQKAEHLLEKVGMAKRLQHKVAELSGGERQRTAFARALIADPVCVFADEPTGNLDHRTAMDVYETMLELNQQVGTSFVIVTHDLTLSARMDRVLLLEDGKLASA